MRTGVYIGFVRGLGLLGRLERPKKNIFLRLHRAYTGMQGHINNTKPSSLRNPKR